tara:strand:- start:682 stop:864 length:183 start_codon:yes stop_codon:yes gene_type:complete
MQYQKIIEGMYLYSRINVAKYNQSVEEINRLYRSHNSSDLAEEIRAKHKELISNLTLNRS